MVDLILALIPGEWLAAAGAAIAALAAVWFGGRKSAKADAKATKHKAEADAMERMLNAETAAGATDAERIRLLSDFAKRNGG